MFCSLSQSNEINEKRKAFSFRKFMPRSIATITAQRWWRRRPRESAFFSISFHVYTSKRRLSSHSVLRRLQLLLNLHEIINLHSNCLPSFSLYHSLCASFFGVIWPKHENCILETHTHTQHTRILFICFSCICFVHDCCTLCNSPSPFVFFCNTVASCFLPFGSIVFWLLVRFSNSNVLLLLGARVCVCVCLVLFPQSAHIAYRIGDLSDENLTHGNGATCRKWVSVLISPFPYYRAHLFNSSLTTYSHL